MSDVMAIGRYQLENLFRSGIRFTFFDLSETESAADLSDLMASAIRIGSSEVLPRLQEQKAAPDAAILLICEDGVKSKTVAQQLEHAGFMNVYRVEGGKSAL